MPNGDDKKSVFREGDEFSNEQIERFISERLPQLEGQVTIKQFPGGHSNLTYLIEVGDREVVLRRPPFGSKVKSAHDMEREFKVLKALHKPFPYVPEPIHYETDDTILGCKFLIMERLKGTIIRKTIPADLTINSETARSLCLNMIEVLHELHTVDYHAAGLADFGRPKDYMQRQVQGWCKRCQNAMTSGRTGHRYWQSLHVATSRPCVP